MGGVNSAIIAYLKENKEVAIGVLRLEGLWGVSQREEEGWREQGFKEVSSSVQFICRFEERTYFPVALESSLILYPSLYKNNDTLFLCQVSCLAPLQLCSSSFVYYKVLNKYKNCKIRMDSCHFSFLIFLTFSCVCSLSCLYPIPLYMWSWLTIVCFGDWKKKTKYE